MKFQNLLDKITQITEKNDREMVSAVLEDSMLETLMEIMEPKIDEIRKEGRIQGTIETLRNLKHKDPEIKSVIMEQYQLAKEEAAGYLCP